MRLPLYIAGRYLFARKSHNVISIISAISAAGMALGTAALILILSVFNGIIKENLSTTDLFNDFDTFGLNIQSGLYEAAGTINNDGVLHWVNLIGLSSHDSLNWFGGGITTHQLFRVWNPIGGSVYNINASYLSNITIFSF